MEWGADKSAADIGHYSIQSAVWTSDRTERQNIMDVFYEKLNTKDNQPWKAKKQNKGYMNHLHSTAISVSTEKRPSKLAEQEAEERMRRKAVEAFDDMWINGGEPDYEYQRKRFIRKLTKKWKPLRKEQKPFAKKTSA